jgi:hypothetical protein
VLLLEAGGDETGLQGGIHGGHGFPLSSACPGFLPERLIGVMAANPLPIPRKKPKKIGFSTPKKA